ncbi:MAG: AbiEi antitoxin N-terminal domain-containing protein [Proteobacteria bacterium]|nr:AbiEi antitoxin N-terminal domain-containing protein [Pseudomonadota bacterium]
MGRGAYAHLKKEVHWFSVVKTLQSQLKMSVHVSGTNPSWFCLELMFLSS